MSPEEWYKNLPPVTKVYWTAAVATTILTSIGAISPGYLYLDFDLVFGKFQIWRLLTNFFFFGNFGMSFIFQVVLLVRYLGMLEEKFGRHTQGTADMLMMLLLGAASIWLLAATILPASYFYGPSLVFMCIYVWSRSDPFAEVVFYGFSFKQWHTPFLFLVMGMLLGGNPVLDLLGIGLGHAYFFARDIVPRNYARTIVWTPQWMVEGVKQAAARWAGTPVPVNSAAPRPNWQRGPGHRLGD